MKRLINNYKNLCKISQNIFGPRINTECKFLFDAVHIDPDGSVYPCCCFERPLQYGNLYKAHIRDIWAKSIKLKLLRVMSQGRALYCFDECMYPVSLRQPCGEKKSSASEDHFYKSWTRM